MHSITIDYDLCDGCRKCYQACFNDVITWDKAKKRPVVSHPQECATCNWCELVCPDHAVKVTPSNPVRMPEPYPKSYYPNSYVAD